MLHSSEKCGRILLLQGYIRNAVKSTAGKEIESMDKKTIDTTVYKLSGHPTLTGYKQLATAVQYCLEDGAFPARNLTVTLYPRIAASLCQTPRSVARSISRAVDDCWEYGDRKTWRLPAGGSGEATRAR